MVKLMATFRPKHVLVFGLIALVSLFSVNYATNSIDAAGGTSNLAPLQPIPVFKDTAHGQWVGYGDGDYIEENWGSLPVDNGQSYNGLPSYKMNVTGGNDGFGWWMAILAGASWESYSIEPYVSAGALEFNIKSDSPVVDFSIAVSDVVFERNPKYCEPVKLSLSNYVTVSSSWQRVSIPLADLAPADANGFVGCHNTDQGSSYPSGSFDPTQIYSIVLSGAGGADFVAYLNDIEWTSPDSEPIYPAVKVNQLGYTPNSPKYALVSGFSDVMLANGGDSFEVRRTSDAATVFNGTLSLLSNLDPASGEKVLKAEFSTLIDAGTYIVHVPGVGDSAEFTIAEAAFDSLVVDSMRYFFMQRQGIELTAANAGIYSRGVGHPQDNAAIFESNTGQTLEVMKGWYDAGDYGKYVNAGATAVSDLLWTYEMFPAEFPDNHLNIPESGNGVPDILDEVRWELEWMLKMQDSDGGFYHMVKSKDPNGGQWDSDTTPDISPDTRYIRDNDVWGDLGFRTGVKPTSVTASGVAGLAHAAIVYQPIDAAFSAELLQAAEAGWVYLQNNNYISTIVGAPYSIPYEDYDNKPYDPDLDDRVWAAAALFRATNDTQYRSYFDANYATLLTGFTSTSENAYGVGNVEIPAVLMYLASTNQTQSVMDDVTADFNQWRDHMLARANGSVWQHTLQDEDYYWGSNYPNLTTPLALAVGTTALGTYDDDIVNLSRKSLNYTLGINSMQFSFVSGYGENSLERPFSQLYNFDGKPGVPPGIMVGGANEYNNAFLFSSFPAKKFSDNAAAWSTNEHTVYWNAVLVFHAALAAHEADSTPPPPPTPTPTVDPNATATPTMTPIPPTATPTPVPPMTDLAISEQTTSGLVQSENYLATHVDGGAVEVLRETTTGGKPSSRQSLLEHTWTFNVSGGDNVVLDATASRPDNSEGDDFIFAWSTDNANFTDMFTVNSSSNQSFSYNLPASTSGTIYIRVVDTERTVGNRAVDDVYIDYLAITNSADEVVTATPVPTDPPPTATPVPTDPAPTATAVPTDPPPTATAVPTDPAPTATAAPTDPAPTATAVPTDPAPTATAVPTDPAPTATAVPTDPPPTATAVPTEPPPTATPLPTTPPPTATPPPVSSIDLVSAEYAESGNISSGSYVDTRIDDGVAEIVLERKSGGKPASRASFIDYRWQVNVTGTGDLTLVTDAWADANSEGDVFTLSYSTDAINFVDMFELGTSSETHTYALPSGISGTLTIRVTDSDQTAGNSNQEAVYIDYMAVHGSGGAGRASSLVDRPAELAMTDAMVVTPTATIDYPFFYTGDGKLIGALSFEIAFDESWVGFDSADSDGNNLPDGLTLNLPAGFSATSTSTLAGSQRNIAISILADGDALALGDGQLGMLTFNVTPDVPLNNLIGVDFVGGSVELLDGNVQTLEVREDSGSLYSIASASAPTAITLSAQNSAETLNFPLIGILLTAAVSISCYIASGRRRPLSD